MTDYQDEEVKAVQFVNGIFIDFFDEHLEWNGNFKDERIQEGVFTSLKFENMIYHRQSNMIDVLRTGELEKVQSMINDIIELSSPVKSYQN